MPERLDLGHLGEEAVAAQVEAPAVLEHGAADAADDVVGLEHHRVLAPFGQEIGGGQASGARADDDDRFALCSHDQGRLADPLAGFGEPRGPFFGASDQAAQGTEMLRKASRAYPASPAASRVSTVRSSWGWSRRKAAAIDSGKALMA